MRPVLTSMAIAVVLAACAAFATAQERTHVHDVRVGAHPGFDRVVIELDGNAEIAWERGPAPGEESFYLDADLGRRARVLHTKLAQVGTVTIEAMRVGTHVSLEPRERRVRAYLLAKPTRLVIDLAPAGAAEFAVPSGVTPLAPATSVGSLKNAPIPAPEHEAEAKPEPEPQHVEAAPVTPGVSGEPVEGAEAASEPPAPEAAAAEAAEPEVTAPEVEATAPEPEAAPEPAAEAEAPAQPAPEVAPEPLPSDSGFPWLLALGTVVVAALVGALGFAVRKRSAEPSQVTRAAPPRPTPLGVEGISNDELRLAADATGVLEQRLDQEVRARVALEERLGEASEELKVLRDRVNRVERRRDEAR
jgi:hypothetical protein